MSKGRVCGSLLAAVLGDCIGSFFEGSPPILVASVLSEVNIFEKDWSESKKRRGEGKKTKWQPIEFTDDTAMARSIAASLVEHNCVNIKDIAKRFAEEYKREPDRGYGGSVVQVLVALADPDLQDLYMPATELFDGTGSCGNGGAMRIAPLGLFYANKPLAELKESTEIISTLTHAHPDGIVGALLQSYAVNLALTVDNSKPLSTADFLQQLTERLQPAEADIYSRYDSARKGESDITFGVTPPDGDLPYCGKLQVIKEFMNQDDVSTEDVQKYLGTNITALGSVPTAVYCFLRGSQRNIPGIEERSAVEQTIMYAISLGGDTDTIATMAAAMSGAFYGMDTIPQSWIESCEGSSQALETGEKMAELIAKDAKDAQQ